MTFSTKLINVHFDLASGNFGAGGNTADVKGHRVSCHIENHGGASQSRMELAIFGMKLSDMNQLTTFGANYLAQTTRQNGVKVEAGDKDGMTLVFQGNIFQAYVDAQSMPQVCLRVMANQGSFYAAQKATPLSFSGATPAATVASQIAASMKLQLENNGVTAVLHNPYYHSDPVTMIHKLSEDARFSYVIDQAKGVLAITPKGKSRPSSIPLVSAKTGMVGYPLFVSNTIVVRTLFNPAIVYQGDILVESDLTPANGKWHVADLAYDLESKMPHGKWFNIITGVNFQAQTPA